MATYGIATQNELGQLLLYSPSMQGVFFRGQTTLTNSGQIQTNEWSNTFAIASPTTVTSFTSFTTGVINVEISGYIPATGLNFVQPSAVLSAPVTSGITGDGPWTSLGSAIPVNVSPQAAFIDAFGKPPAPTAGSYGFRALGPGQNVAIDNNFKSLYIQPKTDGTFIRTGTATTIPSNMTPRLSAVTVSFTQPVTQNIFFDKPYTDPPLIFITQSSGRISMNSMIRNSSGQYIGASIVAAGTFQTTQLTRDYSFTGPSGSNTFSFSYFLVSEELPDYIPQSPWGLKVFNSSGQTIFNSSYFQPSFITTTAPTPYMNLANNQFNLINSLTYTITSNLGICINNFRSMTGINRYNTFAADQGSGFVLWFGGVNIIGKYVHVNGTNVTIDGFGSCAYTTGLGVNGMNGFTRNSMEFASNINGSIDILFCNYTF